MPAPAQPGGSAACRDEWQAWPAHLAADAPGASLDLAAICDCWTGTLAVVGELPAPVAVAMVHAGLEPYTPPRVAVATAGPECLRGSSAQS